MKRTSWVGFFVVLFALGGCVGTQTRPAAFYVLSPIPGALVSESPATGKPLSLGLGPVVLPDLFDRPQIVTRPDPNRVDLAEYDRWGGDLNKDLSRVLVQNLMSRLNTDNIVLYPWSSSRKLDYEIVIQFFRFDGQLGKGANLAGVWRLIDGRHGCELVSHRFDIEEPLATSDYGALVSGLSRAVATLSDDIARRLVTTQPGC